MVDSEAIILLLRYAKSQIEKTLETQNEIQIIGISKKDKAIGNRPYGRNAMCVVQFTAARQTCLLLMDVAYICLMMPPDALYPRCFNLT